MKLSALTAELALTRQGEGDPDITSLTADSRQVRPGALFAALPGVRQDGAAFAADAVRRGAAALLMSESAAQTSQESGLPIIAASQPRLTLALLAARFFLRQPDTVVAVTGTSGKTSVASFARQIFAAQGHRSASLGTLGVVVGDDERYGTLTTPDPVELHRILRELAGNSVTHLALEASSHGLDQFRLDGVRLRAGAFTNLSRDHLDYHGSFEAYLKAKLRLAEALLPKGSGLVVDCDSKESAAFVDVARRRGLSLIEIGGKGQDLRLVERERLAGGQHLKLSGRFGDYKIMLPLIGDFQAANALVAAGLAIAAGEPAEAVIGSLSGLKGVAGRIDKVGEVRGAAVYVDYAHKPDALDNVLTSLRPYTSGRLVVVFGCGGDRDPGKRPIMGRIASERADIVIVTDDNPRSENAAMIRAAAMEGAPNAIEIGSRRDAIFAAIEKLGKGDVLVIAGKGHESGQIVGQTVLPFSDHEVARDAILARGGEA